MRRWSLAATWLVLLRSWMMLVTSSCAIEGCAGGVRGALMSCEGTLM